MSLYQKLLLIILVLAFSFSSFAEQNIPLKNILTEEKILELYRTESIGLKSETAKKNESLLNESLVNENYQAKLYSRYNFSKSQERSLNNFQPILTPYEDWAVGVEKALPIGLKASAEAFGTQYSFQDQSVRDATQVGLRVKGQLDLWKNLFGQLDRAQLSSQDSQKKRAELQFKIGNKKQESELRKLFWSFVSNGQSLNLSKELIKSAESQLQDARKRQREGLADNGEVARYQSQLESRKSSLLLFEYEREVILQNFEKQFPSFKSVDWKFDEDIDSKKQPQVLQCLIKIGNQNQLDNSFTYYDEIYELLNEELSSEIKIAKKHSDIDLALVGEYQTTGVANSYNDARSNLESEDKGGFAVGIQLSIPLGGTKRNSEKYLLNAKKNSLEAQKISLQNDLRSTHATMSKAIQLLNLGLKSQSENSKNLDINYKEMLKKYKQGRIPVTNLILEQDALFNSQLREIEIKKQIAHVMLDYFMVFTDFPCDWNKL